MLSLLINDALFKGFESFSVTKSIESISGSFGFSASGKYSAQAGDRCRVLYKKQALIDGWIDSTEHSYDDSNRSFSVNGRDITSDAIDCSAVLGTGQLFNVSLEEVARKLLQPLGIEVVADVNTQPKFVNVTIDDGESRFEVIERLARHRAVMLQYENGKLLITKPSDEYITTTLVGGINIKQAVLTEDHTERFHSYIIKSQTATSQQWDMTQAIATPSAKAFDKNIRKARTKVLMAENGASLGECKKRAQWQRNIAEARSLVLNIVVQGIEHAPGQLWCVNRLVKVIDEKLDINDAFLIAEITYSLDSEDGLTTSMVLKKPEAYVRLAEKEKPVNKRGF